MLCNIFNKPLHRKVFKLCAVTHGGSEMYQWWLQALQGMSVGTELVEKELTHYKLCGFALTAPSGHQLCTWQSIHCTLHTQQFAPPLVVNSITICIHYEDAVAGEVAPKACPV